MRAFKAQKRSGRDVRRLAPIGRAQSLLLLAARSVGATSGDTMTSVGPTRTAVAIGITEWTTRAPWLAAATVGCPSAATGLRTSGLLSWFEGRVERVHVDTNDSPHAQSRCLGRVATWSHKKPNEVALSSPGPGGRRLGLSKQKTTYHRAGNVRPACYHRAISLGKRVAINDLQSLRE